MIQATVPSDTYQEICEVLDSVRDMLAAKNRRYGNSALNPIRVFSRSDPLEGLRVRIDDKISRLVSGQQDEDEDVIMDLIGYLVLLKIGQRREKTLRVEDPS
jgi:hypothetical protein